ncbi:MAG: lamin tail domain-containing protein [Planctomycetota bacterium]|nr:lamin tail domain-containing protein [Planctomycetota bacterium]
MGFSVQRDSTPFQWPGSLGLWRRSTRRRAVAAVSIEGLERRQLLAATDPIISEFLANNNNGLTDEDGSHSDWIEIYNPASTAVNLAGWHLTDDADKLGKWTFPDTPLAGGGFLKVFASDKRRAIAGQPLHTNFKLDWEKGEYLALVKADNTVAFEYKPAFPPQVEDVSYGLGPDLVTATTLVSTGAPAKFLIPTDDSLATTWTHVGFDDSTGWSTAANGVGYDFAGTKLPTEVEPNNTTGTANSAIYNFAAYSGNLYQLGFTGAFGSSEDWFKIGTLQPGDVITITESGAGSSRGTLTSATVELWRGTTGSNTQVTSDTGSGSGQDALIARLTVTTADTYYIHANAGTNGSYTITAWLENTGATPTTGGTFTAESEGNNSLGGANDASTSWRQVGYRSRTAGAVSSASDVDVFAYQLTKNDRVSINIDSTSSLNAKVTLLDSTGKELAKEDGSSVFASPYDKDSPVYAYIVPANGIYYVKVQTASGTGAYNADVYLSAATAPPSSTGWGNYGGKIQGNIGPQMKGVNSSVYMRLPFAAVDVGKVSSLKLRIDYDDGFVAYLNGTPVAWRNAPDPLSHDSAATSSHAASGFEEIDLTGFANLLLAEDNANVLAIHGLNVSADDTDFLISAELIAASIIVGAEQYFATPTPGQPNQPGALGIVADTKFDHDRGFYDAAFDVVISSATAGAQIRYTTDGTAPTATTGTVYTLPIHVSKTTTLRAAAYKVGFLSSNIDTQTYLFLDDILTQDGVGLPQTWGQSGTVGGPDYAMDPTVVAANAATIRNDLKSLAVVSLVTSVDNWFAPGGVGIYPQGVAIERPVSMEYFNPDGTNAFQANAGVQIIGGGIGGTSAQRWKSYKLSMRVLFKTVYGPGNVRHDIYGEDATDEFDTLVLDAHLNHTWTHPEAGQQTTARFLTDTFVSDAQNSMGGYGPHSQFVHLYLNGIYWGMYDLHERPDEHFAQEYIGGQDENYDVVKHGIQYGDEAIVNGDPATVRADYNALLSRVNADLTVLANYQQVEQILDIDAFIDYMIANHYSGNLDWTNKNWYATYDRVTPGGKWRFHSWDAEHTLENLGDNVTGASGDTGHPRGINDSLKNSPEYRLRFADRVQMHFLTPGGTFYVNPTNPNWDPAHPENNMPAAAYFARMTEIDRAIVGESARWGDNRRPGDAYTREDWLATQNTMLASYFPQRSGVVVNQFRTAGLFPSVAAPVYSKRGGEFTSTYTLTITKTGTGKIYYTTDGSDPRLPGGALNSAKAREYTGPITISTSSRVRARVLDGSTWSATEDANFIIGPPPSIRVSEIMYHPQPPTNSPNLADDYEFIELQNTGVNVLYPGTFTLSGGVTSTFIITQQIEPGDRIILVNNIETFQERYGATIPITGTYTGNLDNAGTRIILSTDLGQLIQDFTFKDGWFGHTDGEGFSIVAIDPAASDLVLSTKAGWRPSYNINGNPNAGDLGYNPNSIVINELLSHPSADKGDWIELYNTTDKDIDISGWFLSDSTGDLQKYKIQPGTKIFKHSYLVFTQADHFGNPANPGCKTVFGFQEHTGDDAHLCSGVNNALGGYRESADFGAADLDVTFGRYTKPSTGDSDFVAMTTPTPNQPNPYPSVGPVVINEIMYSPPTGSDEFIELRNLTNQPVPLFDTNHPANVWQFTNGIAFSFATDDSIPAAGFALVVNIPADTFRTKYSIPAEVPIFGPFTGLLENTGEKLDLSKPGTPEPDGYVPLILVDHVNYNNIAPWPTTPDGSGDSLARLVSANYGNDPANWSAIPDGGTTGQPNFDSTPPTAIISPVAPDPRTTPVSSITLTFSEPVTGFDLSRLTLSFADTLVSLSTQTLTLAPDGRTYTLNNLAPRTCFEGTYTLAIDPAGITDLAGNPLSTPATKTFTLTATTLPATSPADTFYLRSAGTVLQIFQNTLPPNLPTYTLPLDSLRTLNLSQGAYTIDCDLNGTRITLVGSDPANPIRLIFNTPQHLSSLTIGDNAEASLTPNGNRTLQTQALTLSGNGILDLADNDLIIQTGSPSTVLPQVFNWIKSARTGGTWSGPGIKTTQSTDSTGLGVAIKDDSVLVKYTWNGDANLDGIVNADDYFFVDSGFVIQQGGYENGDLNYDGVVNADDYFLIDSAFIIQSGPLAAPADPPQPLFATGQPIARPRLTNLSWLTDDPDQTLFT